MVRGKNLNSRAAVVFLAALLFAGAVRAQGAEEKGNLSALESHLTKKGFVWQDGKVWFPDVLSMCCSCSFPSCYSNNASSQYGFFALPPAPGQDPAVKNPYAEWLSGYLPQGWSYAWRLEPDEAVVFIGKTPPKVEYFGFTAYLYDRYVAGMGAMSDCTYVDGNGQTQNKPQPPSVQSRYPVFASLGDTLNQETIDLAGGRQDPFQKNVVVVVAADQNVLRKVKDALEAAGYLGKSINVLPVPPSLVRPGLASQDDSFMILMRVTPRSGDDVSTYYSQPMTLLRVTPSTPVPVSQLAPILPPKLRVRGTGKTEAYLEGQVDALGQAIVAFYAGLGYTAAPVKMAILPDGFNCISNMQNCLADNRDTIYVSPAYDMISQKLLQGQPSPTLGPNEFLVVYGVQHQLVHKALYTNISIMGWYKKAAAGVVTDAMLANSAQNYLPGADPVLYAYQITRSDGDNCTDPQHCIKLGYGCGTGIAAAEPVAPIFRAYLEPGKKVGPSRGEVVIDHVLKFTPAQ
ncbi:MAG: hypothetical protein ACP5VF_11695 [Acidobacteriota bacterium]